MSEPTHLDELGKVQLASECYVFKDNKILMFKRSETASKFPGWWIGPGGHIDEGEDAQSAAIFEEAGIKVEMKDIKLKAVAFHHHIDREEVWISFVYIATITEDQKEKVVDDEGKSKWIPLDELLVMENVFPPSKYYFDHVLNDKQGIMYTNIQWEKAQLVKVISERVDVNG
jgi:8-oxo-dGTP pyrophosphatase MutT (NUDIX family)